MRTPLALVALSLIASCEKEPLPEAAAAPPAPAPTRPESGIPFVQQPPPPPEVTPPACQQPDKRWKGIGVPPSVYPKQYSAWLASLCGDEQQKIQTFCAQHPLDFQVICGGIGTEHIPYPPYPRASARPKPGVIAIFHSTQAWHASLSKAQLAYIDEKCVGGEDRDSSDLCGDNTPLVIALHDQPIEFVADGTFDWPTTSTPWLALDRDGNGTIDGEAELFGSATVLADGTHAPNGFIALEELDANHDGTIDARDPAFAKLQLWADADRDRHGTASELTAASTQLVSISLADHVDLRCDARRNCEGERATIVWRDGAGQHEGSVVDVYLPRR
jgi:hypothetical protein